MATNSINGVQTYYPKNLPKAKNTPQPENIINVQKNEPAQEPKKLSEAAQNYLKTLQEKFGNVNFIVVEGDVTGNEKGGGTGKVNCFISMDLLEKMAADEATAEKYEGIITDALVQLDDLKTQVKEKGLDEHVEGYSISIDSSGKVNYTLLLKDSIKDLYAPREKNPEKPEHIEASEWERMQWRPLQGEDIETLLEKLQAIVDGKAEVPMSFYEEAMERINSSAKTDILEGDGEAERIKRAFSSPNGKKDGFDLPAMLPRKPLTTGKLSGNRDGF